MWLSNRSKNNSILLLLLSLVLLLVVNYYYHIISETWLNIHKSIFLNKQVSLIFKAVAVTFYLPGGARACVIRKLLVCELLQIFLIHKNFIS